jgi:hypothetical protein
MPHALRAALLVCLLLPFPASAVTFAFTGTVDETVTDPENFLDDSVAPGIGVSGTYDVDLTTADGSSPFDVGVASLSFQLGNYGFDRTQDPHRITLINDTGPPGFIVDIWQSLSFAVGDLNPGTNYSGNFGGYAVRIEFFDNTATNFDGSETAPFVPSDLSDWSFGRLLLDSLDGSGSPDGRVQVQVNFTSWAPVPEPRTGVLLALGLASLAHHRRRRARAN